MPTVALLPRRVASAVEVLAECAAANRHGTLQPAAFLWPLGARGQPGASASGHYQPCRSPCVHRCFGRDGKCFLSTIWALPKRRRRAFAFAWKPQPAGARTAGGIARNVCVRPRFPRLITQGSARPSRPSGGPRRSPQRTTPLALRASCGSANEAGSGGLLALDDGRPSAGSNGPQRGQRRPRFDR
jgi:hypothetical protein